MQWKWKSKSGRVKRIEAFRRKREHEIYILSTKLDHMGPAKHSTSGRLPWPAGILQAVRVLDGLWWLVDYQRT